MMKYTGKSSTAVTAVRFTSAGAMYDGNGFLAWDPKNGFRLQAHVERLGPPLQGPVQVGQPKVLEESDFSVIRMRAVEQFAVSPLHMVTQPVHLGDELSLLTRSYLDIRFGALRSARRYPISVSRQPWSGSARYDIGKNIMLPDAVEHETRVGDLNLGKGFSRTAITVKDETLDLFGQLESNRFLELCWVLHNKAWTRRDAWQFPEIVQSILCFLSGWTVQLLQRSMYRGSTEFLERSIMSPVKNLGFLAPLRTFPLDKELFLHLAKHMLSDHADYAIFRNVIRQLAAAAAQETQEAKELLCATILEAILRTNDCCAFSTRSKKWKLRRSLLAFREKYLSTEWRSACNHAVRAWEVLRHRNAHPDWLTSEGGGKSKTEFEKSVDYLMYLSRFYAYMILAKAGVKGFKPQFSTLGDFKPSVTITPPANGKKSSTQAEPNRERQHLNHRPIEQAKQVSQEVGN